MPLTKPRPVDIAAVAEEGWFTGFELPRGTPRESRFNLSESTVASLRLGELLELAGDELSELALDYGDPAGYPELRDALGAGLGVAADTILTFPGTMLGLYLLACELCQGGKEALLVTPCFGPMRDALERAGARIRIARLRFEEGYRADIDRIAAALRPDTRLVCLADPQNPSGVRIPREAIEALLFEMARRSPQAVLFLDETYREATYGDAPARSLAAIDDRMITAASLSKAHGAPGLRVGWLTVPDRRLHDRLLQAKALLLISGSVLDEAIAALVLSNAAAILPRRQKALREALATVRAWHRSEADRLDMIVPQAGALCCLRLSDRVDQGGLSRFWAALPAEQLRLAPGTWFGETPRIFRLGFGHVPSGQLEAALRALSRAIAQAF